MTDISPSAIRFFEKAIDSKRSKSSRKRESSQPAIVTRVDEDGMAWVHIPGGSDETPVRFNTAEVSKGDVVDVTIQNGYAKINGNVSHPSTDNTVANFARVIAVHADENAIEAAAAAFSAQESAESAAFAANQAQNSATQANTYANAALDQLGIVQDVVGVLDWASTHGGFVQTSDSSIVDGKVYFTYDSTTHDYIPVVNPQASGLSSYYELDTTGEREAMTDFILSHLAVTQRGLWVLPSGIGNAQSEQYANGYKVLLSNDAMYIYDDNGVLVNTVGESITYSSSRPQYIGNEDAYIVFTPATATEAASITIGGSNIRLGDARPLSELIGKIDRTLIYDHTYEYNAAHTSVTFTAHLYNGGEDVAGDADHPANEFSWYLKSEDSDELQFLGTGLTCTINDLDQIGYGAHVVGKYTPTNDASLLTEDDDNLTDSQSNNLTGRTSSGDSVRVSDLSVSTTVYPTDKVLVVGSEDEHLVSIETLTPSIEGVKLVGNKTYEELNLSRISNTEIESMLS